MLCRVVCIQLTICIKYHELLVLLDGWILGVLVCTQIHGHTQLLAVQPRPTPYLWVAMGPNQGGNNTNF